jgi:hypothetical protein
MCPPLHADFFPRPVRVGHSYENRSVLNASSGILNAKPAAIGRRLSNACDPVRPMLNAPR